MTNAKHDAVAFLMLGGLLCIVVVLCYAADKLSGLDARIAMILNDNQPKIAMQTITQVVTRANGTTVTLTTTRKEGEALADWIARHDAAVAALEA